MKYAILGTTRLSFGDRGRIAYWDGWYSDKADAEAVLREACAIDYPWLTFVVVQGVMDEPVEATSGLPRNWLQLLEKDIGRG